MSMKAPKTSKNEKSSIFSYFRSLKKTKCSVFWPLNLLTIWVLCFYLTAKCRGSEKRKKEPRLIFSTLAILCLFSFTSLCISIIKGLTLLSDSLGDQHLQVWSSGTTIAPSGLDEGKQFCYCRPFAAGNTVQLSTMTYISYWGAFCMSESVYWLIELAAYEWTIHNLCIRYSRM